MDGHRFSVFGTAVVVARVGGGWQAFYPGADGTRRAADFIVPADIAEHALAEYLADLFHENATPRHATVERLA
jgi:hypothetical protein